MSDDARTVRNFISLTGAQMVSMVASLVTAMVLSRALQPESFGILGFGTAILSYLGLAVVLGTDTIGVRDVAREPDDTTIVKDIVGMRLAIAAIAMTGLAVVVPILPQSETVKQVLLIQGCGLFVTAVTIDYYFQGTQRMGVIALRQIVGALASVFAVLALVRGPADIYIAAAIPIAAVGLGVLLLLVVFVRRTRSIPFRLKPSTWPTVARRSLPLAFAAIMVTVYYNIDIVMLGFMTDATSLGWYTASARVLTLGFIAGEMLRAAFLPRLARLRDNPTSEPGTLNAFALSVLLIGITVAVIGITQAGPIIRILFGESYLGGTQALAILMAAVAVYHVVIVYGSPLVAWDRDKTFAGVSAFGAVANVALNLYLIPRHGIEGAATATLISQSMVALALAIAFYRMSGVTFLSTLLRLLVAGAVGGAALVYGNSLAGPLGGIGDAVLRLCVASIVFGIIYLTIGYALGVVKPGDARTLIRMAKRRGGDGDPRND